MQIELFMKNKIKRQILWNGQDFNFVRYKQDNYHQDTDEVLYEFPFKGIFHEGGGYGGMLNIELYERDGSRSVSKMKPMILCLKDDNTKQLLLGDVVFIGENKYKMVDKVDVKNLGIAYELSLEVVKEDV